MKGRRIVVGVTGGIAAYKAAELVRELKRLGAEVRVVMTANAMQFVSPLTFEILSGQPVATELFRTSRTFEIDHISLANYAELIALAPATANIIAKMAGGIADDLLTTVVLATTSPILVCPSMNAKMYANPVVSENIKRLKDRGYRIMEPVYGELACGEEGRGRLPEPKEIVEEIEDILTKKDLAGQKIVVTAGPTQEPLDPVRYLSNHSSGKMGFSLAIAARRRGAQVSLITGPTFLSEPRDVRLVRVATAVQMRDAVIECMDDASVIIMAAAVSDYRPSFVHDKKIKKSDSPLTLSLEPNPDIIKEICKRKGTRIVVGFSMETEDILDNARKKLRNKHIDIIVANDVTMAGAGFGVDTNIVTIIDRHGREEKLPLLTKIEVANVILDRVAEFKKGIKTNVG